MPAYASKGNLVNYITSEGVLQSKLVSMAQIGDMVYYRLENGDYVRDTPIGRVKAFENVELLMLLGDNTGGKILQ